MTEENPTTQFISVAIPSPLNQLFTYKAAEPIAAGVRVKVPFGPRHVVGVVCDSSDRAPETTFKLKNVSEIIDDFPVYSPSLLRLAQWISQYYLHPIGEVFRVMLPAGSKSAKKLTYLMTEEGAEFLGSHDEHAEVFRHCFGKRRKLTQVTLRKKLKAWHEDVTDLERWFVNKGFLSNPGDNRELIKK